MLATGIAGGRVASLVGGIAGLALVFLLCAIFNRFLGREVFPLDLIAGVVLVIALLLRRRLE
jgi:hypothetical protein